MKGVEEFIKKVSNVRTSASGTCADFKKEGNLRYKLGDFFTAASAYTRCLALVDPGDPERAQIYATRSAVLMAVGHFRDAVRDVERALQNNYPAMMRFRLHLRMAIAFRELGEVENAHEQMEKTRAMIAKYDFPEEKKTELLAIAEKSFAEPFEVKVAKMKVEYLQPPELSYAASETWPCLSSAVEIKASEKFGRHWIAAQDVQTGDVLLKEDPAVSGLKNDSKWTHCSHCFKSSFCLNPCTACNKDLYCSDMCQALAWKNYHHVICQPRKKYEDEFREQFDLSENIFSSFLRIFDFIAFFGVENCANFDNPSHPADSPRFQLLKEFLQLVHHPLTYEDHIRSLCRDILVHCFDLADEMKVAKLSEFCSLALLKHNANSFSVEECFIYAATDEFDLKHIAYGSYHTASLANHSCDPNVVCTYFGKTMVCRAIRPVKMGEQLFLRYCNTFYNLPKTVRHEKLSQYNFECDCEPCKFDWPVAKMMPEEPTFVDQNLAASLKSLLMKESQMSGLAIAYWDLVNDEILQLCKRLQQFYFSPKAAPRLDKMYRLVEMVIFYHWAAKTKSYVYNP